jgi:hypothetical protein
MTKPRVGPGIAVFVLFFGVAALDAVRSANWPRVAFWLVVGLTFLALDSMRSSV